MPTSDLDMPLLPSAEQIRRREFATVRRGYDPQQVRTYLTSIANQVQTLERELSQLRLEAGSAAASQGGAPKGLSAPEPAQPTEDPYDALSKRFAALIEMADQEAQKTIEEARSEADRIRVDAQARAEEARQQGTDLLERARDESDRILSGLADRRRGLVAQLEQMRAKLLTVADDLAIPLEEAARADAEDAVAESAAQTEGDDPVDPRYEELWVSEEGSVDIPDLAAIDLDFDEPDET